MRETLLSLLCLLSIAFPAPAADPVAEAAAGPEGYSLLTSSYLGGEGDADEVVGAVIQSDGSVVLAANLAAGTRLGEHTVPPPVEDADGPTGVVLRLSPDGRKVHSMMPMTRLNDLAVDASDHLYAATRGGLVKLHPAADAAVYVREYEDVVSRVDAAPDGTVAVFVGGKANQIVILSPEGKEHARLPGKDLTQDICIDGESKTVVYTGFRNAKAFDGKRTFPVQIAYLKAVDYNGQAKWSDYGWTTNKEAEQFLNRPTNNMADTRGYRCSIGADGKLYAAFEAAGGNHIFRYSPRDINMKSDALTGGDQYHQFHNSKAEHKTIFGRFDPATGDALKTIQFTGRLASGKANAVRVKNGTITADADGRVYLGGAAAYGLPMTYMPAGTGDYTGGAFFLIESPDFDNREVVGRFIGGGTTTTLAVRDVDGQRRIVIAGPAGKPDQPLATAYPLQETPSGIDAFFAVMVAE